MSKRYYMHTIDGQAAFYSKANQQIVYAELRDHWEGDYPLCVMRESVEQIREDQRKSAAWRERQGFKPIGKMDFVILSLEDGLIPWKPAAKKAPAKKAALRRTRR